MFAPTQPIDTAKAEAARILLEEQYAYFTPEAPKAREDTAKADETPGTLPYHSAA